MFLLPNSVTMFVFPFQGERGPPGESVLGTQGIPGVPGEKGPQVCDMYHPKLNVKLAANILCCLLWNKWVSSIKSYRNLPYLLG